MNEYIIQMLLFSGIYLLLIYFAVKIYRKISLRRNKGSDDEGGIEVYNDPDLDLPPGVTKPDGGPRVRIKKDDLEEVSI